MSKDFNLIMENWRNFSSEETQGKEVLQEQSVDSYKKMYMEHYNGVQQLLDKYSSLMKPEQVSDIENQNKMYLKSAREIGTALNDNMSAFAKDLEAMLAKDKSRAPQKPEAPQDLPIAAESKNLNEEDDKEKLVLPPDSEEKLTELKTLLPQLAEQNPNLLKLIAALEAVLQSGTVKEIREVAGRIANVIFNLAKNEKKAGRAYEVRLRAMYLLIGVTGVEVTQFVIDQQSWVLKFMTNTYGQYSAAFRTWVQKLHGWGSHYYNEMFEHSGDQLAKAILDYGADKGADAVGVISRTTWAAVNKVLQGNVEKLSLAAKDGGSKLKEYVDGIPLLRKIFEDLAIVKNISRDDVPGTLYEAFVRGFESIWAFIMNAGVSSQFVFVSLITMGITSLVYNWYTKDPQNPIAIAYLAFTQALKNDIGKVIKLWKFTAKSLKDKLLPKGSDKKEIEESLLKMKIILDKRALGVI